MIYIPVNAVTAPSSAAEFEASYLSRPDRGPVLFTGSAEAAAWPAMGWTLESLAAKIGQTKVHVRSRTSTKEYREGKRYCIEEMPFSKYAALLLAEEKGAPDYYLAIQNVLRNFPGLASRRRDCHFADIPSPSILKHLLQGEGVQQNDSLADG